MIGAQFTVSYLIIEGAPSRDLLTGKARGVLAWPWGYGQTFSHGQEGLSGSHREEWSVALCRREGREWGEELLHTRTNV